MSHTENDALRRFAYEVVQVIQWNQTPQVKVGAICKLARQKKGLKGVEVAKAAGCTQGHYSLLEAGGKKRLDSYRTAIDALRLDRAKLIYYVTVPQQIDMAQAHALLLADDAATAGIEVDHDQTCSALLDEVMSILRNDWPPARKAGQICRLTRLRQELSQKAIGHRVGRSNMYISALENGQKPLTQYPPVLRAIGLDEKLLTIIDGEATPENAATVEALLRDAIVSRGAIDRPQPDSADAASDRGMPRLIRLD